MVHFSINSTVQRWFSPIVSFCSQPTDYDRKISCTIISNECLSNVAFNTATNWTVFPLNMLGKWIKKRLEQLCKSILKILNHQNSCFTGWCYTPPSACSNRDSTVWQTRNGLFSSRISDGVHSFSYKTKRKNKMYRCCRLEWLQIAWYDFVWTEVSLVLDTLVTNLRLLLTSAASTAAKPTIHLWVVWKFLCQTSRALARSARRLENYRIRRVCHRAHHSLLKSVVEIL